VPQVYLCLKPRSGLRRQLVTEQVNLRYGGLRLLPLLFQLLP
jgi:hypothetical protein